MITFIKNCLNWLWKRLDIVANLSAENIALRQQIVVLKRKNKRPKVKERDRIFWVLLSRFWPNWRSALLIVKPETVIGWHKRAFKFYWWRKSQFGKRGRQSIDPDIRNIVLQMAKANPLWGAPKIHGELLKLGIEISERTVSNLIQHLRRKPPSQTWKTFIHIHLSELVAIDFLIVPTIRFQLLYVFIVLSHLNRRVLHFNVTTNPTAEWSAQQIIEAFPWDTVLKYLLRDRDSIYGKVFQNRVQSMGIKEVITAYRNPWQNAYAERLNGSIRRECTDQIIVMGERHLKTIFQNYFDYYHDDRTHIGLEKETPRGRPNSNRSSTNSKLIELPRVGGLHHRYEWSNAA